MRERGFSDETIINRRYGYVQKKEWMDAYTWAIEKKSCIERGILIPWFIQGELWKLSLRLFDEERERNIREGFGDNCYRCVTGGNNGLYRADTIRKHQPLFIFEGEFNADLLAQELERAGMNGVAVIATGSTSKGRADNWLTRIASASPIILAFDSDHGGDKAIQEYWGKCLPHAMPYRTIGGDLNEMHLAGFSLPSVMSADSQIGLP